MIMNQSSFKTPSRAQSQRRRRNNMYTTRQSTSNCTYYRPPRAPADCGYSSEASAESPLMLPTRPRRQTFQTLPRKLPVCFLDSEQRIGHC